MKRTPMRRSRKPIKPFSDKRTSEKPERDAIRDEMLSRWPVCVRCRQAPSTDCHEVQTRARRPGAHLLRELITPLCRPCHTLVTQGRDLLWLLPSTASLEVAAAHVNRLRGPGNNDPF